MAFFYFLIVKLYGFGIVVVSLFNHKAKQWVNGRKNWETHIEETLHPGEKRIIFHCPSLGEFEQGKPVIESLRKNYPEYKIVLTFFSPSGYELRKNDPLADYVFYLPLDGPRNAKRFTELISPTAVFFVKYDFWHFFIKEFKDQKIPVFFVSSIFRPTQIYFQWYGKFFDKMLRRVTHFFVQSQSSLELLYKNSIPQVTVTGDTRFDRVYENSLHTKSLPEIESFKGNKKLLIAGSTWLADEINLQPTIDAISDQYKFIIVPHETGEARISGLMNRLGNKAIRYSTWDKKSTDASILVIDHVGMLSSLYRYADIAYIGGGFGKGIHNILEAAVFGIPVFFGPNYKKFREANELIHWKGAFTVKNGKALSDKVTEVISDNTRLEKIKEINLKYITNNKGATELIISHIRLNSNL